MPMTSNRKPQFLRQIFSLQSNGAAEKRVDASVRQDKARISSAQRATPQPAPHTKNTREHSLNSKLYRSQKRPTRTKRTKKLTLWVEPIVKEELERIAKREKLSLSKSGAAFLKRSLQQNIDLEYSALLTPIIEAAIDRRLRSRDARLAWLLVRVAFDSGQTRAIVANILGRQQGITEESLKTILAMSQRTAKGSITRKTPQIAELMEAVEKWLAEDEKKEPSN
jgi:hypothetical protein